MKNRSKMILGLASMLGISAGATAVSGFAWFTTQRTAAIGASQFKVGASEGSLKIEESTLTTPCTNCSSLITGSKQAITVTSGKVLADISSCDGTNFYKAKLGVDGGVSSVIKETGATSTVNTSQINYVSWQTKVSNSAANTTLDVYLSNNGSIFSHYGDQTNSSTISYKVSSTTQTAFTWDGVATAVTDIKVNGTAPTTNATLTGSEGAYTGFTLATAANKDDLVTATVTFDYSQFYRLVVLDLGNDGSSSKIVFRYSNSKHLSYLKGTTETAVNGTGVLTAAVEKSENADSADKLYAETEATVCTINSSKDVTDHEYATTAEAGNQLLIKGLGSEAHILKFVVWCEGTATPEASIADSNSVKMDLSLIGLTA